MSCHGIMRSPLGSKFLIRPAAITFLRACTIYGGSNEIQKKVMKMLSDCEVKMDFKLPKNTTMIAIRALDLKTTIHLTATLHS